MPAGIFFYLIYTLNAILHTLCLKTGTFKYCLSNLCIQIIILCQKDFPVFKDFTICFWIFSIIFYIIVFIRYLMFQCNCKVLPFPSSLSTSIVPPSSSTYFLTIDIPSPVPAILLFVVFRSRVNASKIFVRYS